VTRECSPFRPGRDGTARGWDTAACARAHDGAAAVDRARDLQPRQLASSRLDPAVSAGARRPRLLGRAKVATRSRGSPRRAELPSPAAPDLPPGWYSAARCIVSRTRPIA